MSVDNDNTSDADFMAMSDEDFLKQNPPEDVVTEEPVNTGSEEPNNNNEPVVENNTENQEEEPVSETTEENKEENTDNKENNSGQTENNDVKENKEESLDTNSSKESGKSDKEPDNKTKEESSEPDFAAIGKQILTPFKANGKTVTPKNAEEAVKLMQMGANYTQKMQQIQPYRKVITMLQNADMLDEGQLGFLIDLGKKDPEAIRKLIKDSGIDPMDIDTSKEPAYQSGKNQVSDSQVAFNEVLDTVSSTPSGQETLSKIHNTWDDRSKVALGQNPQIMYAIQSQMENGIYNRIAEEIDRRKTLGSISPSLPFIEAYQQVGVDLDKQGAFNDLAKPVSSEAAPIAVSTPTNNNRKTVKNADKVAAAAPTRGRPSGKSPTVNPLSLSDEEFLKQMQGRL